MLYVLEILHSIVLGVLGAFTNVLLHSTSFEELKKYRNTSTILLGAIAGYVYYLMIQSYNFPDHVVTFIVGYFARDFFTSLANRNGLVRKYVEKRICGVARR